MNAQTIIKPQKISEQILAVLEACIVFGEYPVGSKLPPERRLAEAFGAVAPVGARGAENAAAREMLEARQGDGYYVSAKPQQDFLLGWQSLLGNHPDWEAMCLIFSRSTGRPHGCAGAERRTDADLKRIEF